MESVKEKPVLECKEQTYIVVEYYKLEQLIKTVYGTEINVVSCQEWRNDSHNFIRVRAEAEDWDRDVEKKLISGEEPSYGLDSIMTCLCADGYIRPGEYMISVCW